MIGLFLVKHFRQNFKMVCLALACFILAGCNPLESGGSNGGGGSGGGGGNGGGGNTCTGIEENHPDNPNCVLTGTEGLMEITDDVNSVDYVASVEVKRLIALVVPADTIGVNDNWLKSATDYPSSGAKPPSGVIATELLYANGSPVFSFNMKDRGGALYLFTVSTSTYNFTFDLLFVKTASDGEDYSVTANNVKYIGDGYEVAYPNGGEVYNGNIDADQDNSVFYNVYPEFPDGVDKTIISDTAVKIYMVVDVYGSPMTGKNVIRIK